MHAYAPFVHTIYLVLVHWPMINFVDRLQKHPFGQSTSVAPIADQGLLNLLWDLALQYGF